MVIMGTPARTEKKRYVFVRIENIKAKNMICTIRGGSWMHRWRIAVGCIQIIHSANLWSMVIDMNVKHDSP